MAFGAQSPTQTRPKEESYTGARIKVIGVGGGGNNAVNRMIDAGMKDVEFISVNTDLQSLQTSRAPTTLQLGARISRGLGSGGNPDIGRGAAIEDADEIITALDGADMVFITAGLGGGTGTGAAPIIASLASRMGALTVAVVTRPFAFEGKRRMAQAQRGLEELLAVVDTLIVIPNEKLLTVAHDAGFFDSFEVADDVLRQAVQGIADIVTLPGLINRDFADVRATLSGMGYAVMGSASRSGTARATKAAMAAIASPLLDDAGINGARGILMHVSGSRSLKLAEVNEAAMIVQRSAHEDANILFGTTLDEELGDKIKITVIAAGFGDPKLPRQVNQARASLPEQVLPQREAADLYDRRAPQPVFAEPIAAQPIATQAVATQPVVTQAVATQPVVTPPVSVPAIEDWEVSETAAYTPAPDAAQQAKAAPPPLVQEIVAPKPLQQVEAVPEHSSQPFLSSDPPLATAVAPEPMPQPVATFAPPPETAAEPEPLLQPVATFAPPPETAAEPEPLPQAVATSEPFSEPAVIHSAVEIEEVVASPQVVETIVEPPSREQPAMSGAAHAAAPTAAVPAAKPAPITAAVVDATPILVSAQQTAVAAYAAIAMPEPEVDEEDDEDEFEPLPFAALLEARRQRLESMDPGPLVETQVDPIMETRVESLMETHLESLIETHVDPIIEDTPPVREPYASEPFQRTTPPWFSEAYQEDELDDESDAESIVDTHSLSQPVGQAVEDFWRAPVPEEISNRHVAPVHLVVDPPVIEPAVIEPAVIEPPVIEPAVIEPPVIEPAVIEPPVIEPSLVEPAVIEPSLVEPAMKGSVAPRDPVSRVPEPEQVPEARAMPLWSARGLAWARSLDFSGGDFNDRLGRQADVGPSGEIHKAAVETPVPSFAGVQDPEGELAELDELDIPAFLRRFEQM